MNARWSASPIGATRRALGRLPARALAALAKLVADQFAHGAHGWTEAGRAHSATGALGWG
ncbi:MAG: hypothetical protein JO100_12940 [Pseudonocardia sp.]|nr:hypothetical protein [Pseudonocardia sp.]